MFRPYLTNDHASGIGQGTDKDVRPQASGVTWAVAQSGADFWDLGGGLGGGRLRRERKARLLYADACMMGISASGNKKSVSGHA